MRWLLPLVFWACSGNAEANCLAVVDLSTELPPEQVTPAGVTLEFDYDLEDDRYWVAWRKGDESGGPMGPFHLTMACQTARFEWENDRFLVLSRGCGNFCWSWEVFSLTATAAVEVIERPLAYDAERNLVARYADQDLIEIRNLISGAAAVVRTRDACEFFSGLCFSDVRFRADVIEYTWRETGAVVDVPLPKAVLPSPGS